MDIEQVRASVQTIATLAETDPKRAHEYEDALFVDILYWIRGEQDTPNEIRAIAVEALRTRLLTFSRWG